MKPLDFFVSYTQSDRQWAEWIAWQLQLAGYSVRVQAWDFRPGDSFVQHMQQGLVTCKHVLAIYSPEYFASPYTREEWQAVVASNIANDTRRLMPVRVKPCSPPGLLSHRIFIDLAGISEEAEAIDALRRGISESGRPSTMPDYPGTVPATHQAAYPQTSNNPPDLATPIRSYAHKLEMPGAYWRNLSANAQILFYLLGRTNKSWVQRTERQKQKFASDLVRVAQNGGQCILISDTSAETKSAMVSFLQTHVSPLITSAPLGRRDSLLASIRYLTVQSVHYQAVRSDDKLVVLPYLNSERFREEAVVLEFERTRQPLQFQSYADDLERLMNDANPIPWH